ncbi:discoidin domain-containing protein [Kosakonia sp. MH5]|uniref:discoidin domain-containing protein n=1 Tax=Kosakonia sp. MH5 TaxID=2202822 RepID=UPI0013751F8E|nr:discoidin domain-containing protein [Kosakonia sp. MH5]NCF03824.1 carbohydrate-binding protein [Kosakonia sp. MH5]
MPSITELNEFTADIPLLELDTPARGYDGVDIGPDNEQAQRLANRTKWLKQRVDNLLTAQVRSVNGKSGTVTLTVSDVGADPAGTADSLLTAHVNDADPHPQYFNETRGDVRYVQVSLANTGNGWLQLDASGKIPAAQLSAIASRYVVAADQTARLALASSANLTICAQADIDTLFYLNGGANPAVAANWVQGQSATVSGVSSVFGRTGAVTAQAGDYSADQINETADRKFVTPAEKSAWSAKQDVLVSGSNIRSLFGLSLTGSGNLAPTPAQMGAAATQHTHAVADIADFTQQTQALIVNSLEAGSGITLGQSPVSGKTIISASGSGAGGGGGYIVVDRAGATAGQVHSFSFAPQSGFNLCAYALKSEQGQQNKSYTQDAFPAGSEAGFNTTADIVFNAKLGLITQLNYVTAAEGGLFSAEVLKKGKSLVLSTNADNSIVPKMTANNAPAGYTVSASSVYDSGSPAYSAFDRVATTAWVTLSGPTQWIQIKLPEAKKVNRFRITNRTVSQPFQNNPRTFALYGSNDGTNFTLLANGTSTSNVGDAQTTVTIPAPAAWLYYRLTVTAVFQSGSVTLGELELLGDPSTRFLLNGSDGKYYTVVSGALSEVAGAIDSTVIANQGVASVTLTESMQQQLGDAWKLVTGESVEISGVLTPDDQIALPLELTGASAWSTVNSATITASLSGAGATGVAVTRDLNDYVVFDGTAWVSIGGLTADTAGAEKLIAQGMAAAAVSALTAVQWAQLWPAGVPDRLAFAYALHIADAAADKAEITGNVLSVNEVSAWKLQTPAEVEIRWYADSVSFKTLTAGDYKLAYQIPD